MKYRFLYLVGQLRPGGSERQLYYLLTQMDRQRHCPAVVVWDFNERDTYVSRFRAQGVPLFSFPPNASRIGKLQWLRRLVAQSGAQVIHSYSPFTNFAAWWAAWGTTTLPIGGVRCDFKDAIAESGPILGRLCARWPRSQIFNNLAAAQTARQLKSLFTPGQIIVVRNGLDTNYFNFVPLSLTEPTQVLGIGSLYSVKRWDRLLNAAAVLKSKGLNFIVRIAGEGPSRLALEQTAKRLGLQDQVHLVGYSPDIPDLLAQATFLVHTSDSEGLPNSVLEAMACGRAVIATNVGDSSALIEDAVNGYLVSPGDEAALVERMATLIRDRALCKRLGEAGRVKVEREFGLDRLVEETLTAYRAAGWVEA